MIGKLENKVAVITGASRGLGQAISVGLAQAGAQVILVARGAKQLADSKALVERNGGKAFVYPADIGQPRAVEGLMEQVLAQVGAPSILVNAAGIFGPIQLIKDSDPTRWIETLQTNTIAPYLTSRAFVGAMIKQGWGRIINVSSAAALHTPGPINSAYGVSKVALNQFTRHLAAEIANTGVTANVIHPGEVKTEMWADIREQAKLAGVEAEGYRQWVRWVDETGGDPAQKTVELVFKLLSDEAASINGQFLWIEDGLQKPIASW